jgi:hypothetical protein
MSKSPWLWFLIEEIYELKKIENYYIYRRGIINSNFGFLINGENSTPLVGISN